VGTYFSPEICHLKPRCVLQFGASYIQIHLMVQGILGFHDGDYENVVFWDVRLHSLVDTNQHFAQICLPNMTSHPRTK
jgi:hypothetical protein